MARKRPDEANAADEGTLSTEERLRRAALEREELAELEHAAAARRLQWEKDEPAAHAKEQRALAYQRDAMIRRAEEEQFRPPAPAPGALAKILERGDVRQAVDDARKRLGVVAPIKELRLPVKPPRPSRRGR